MTRTAFDPVSLEILSNALRSVTDETYVALMKSAYSTNIKERHDHSTAIMDRQGRLVVQAAESLPIHIASMSGLMARLLEKYRDDVRDGDLFVANDPHAAGGTHLPDVNLAMPVFAGGTLFAFVCNIAHHADIGGMAPGSMAGGMSEIYQEGLRIPVIKLFREGELQQDLLDLLLLNVRVPEERRGDYFAQIAACRLGARRLREVVAAHGAERVGAAFGALIERTETRMRDAIETIPDGDYAFCDVMDGDGLDAHAIPIRLRVRIEGRRAHFDFRGTSPQVPGNVNVTLNATQASVCYGLKALLDPEVPNNQGVLAVAEISAEPGTLLNATFPASVASRAHTCQRIVDVVLGALAPALPGRVVAAANGANTTAVFAGTDPRHGRPYVYLETLGGGMGARPDRDGKDGVQVHITNTSPPTSRWRRSRPSIRCWWRSTAWSRIRAGRDASGAAPGPAPAGAPDGPHLRLQRRGRALQPPALGTLRRSARRLRPLPAPRARRHPAPPARQARRAPSGSGAVADRRDPGRGRLRTSLRARPGTPPRRPPERQVQRRLPEPPLSPGYRERVADRIPIMVTRDFRPGA